MTKPTAEVGNNKLHKMYFQLRYITTDFEFGNTQIIVSDPAKKMEFLMRKRISDDGPLRPLESGDGIVTVTCEKEVAERLHREAVSSGQVSIKKGAVNDVFQDMCNHMKHTIRLIRWRTNSHGRPNPVREAMHGGFKWSLDGNDWRPVGDYIAMKINLRVNPQWTTEAAQFVATEVSGGLDEPLGHVLLREAWNNRGANPRSSIVLAVAAAEVGFKQFVSKVFPDTAWLLENVPSPPLVKMLTEFFPWSKLKVQINGKEPKLPESITSVLKKAVLLRDLIVHRSVDELSTDTVDSVLTSVRDLLYFLDSLQGQEWAFKHLSTESARHFVRAEENNPVQKTSVA